MRDLTKEEEEKLRQWWRHIFAACGYGLVVMGSFDTGAPLGVAGSSDEQVSGRSPERIPAPTEK
ncbi:MAG TPA: hypothetical protein VM677_31420 [Actinokineospora sp.]|jgi:hypothetical protein|nr:hypothetical protein [Actinokineospora sp.]